MTTLRGSTAGAFTSNAQVLTLPTGTVAGDIAVLFAYDGYVTPALSNITNWTMTRFVTGFGDGLVAYKTLTSADVTAGSVTVTWSNSYGGYAALSTVAATVGVQYLSILASTFNGDTGTGRTITTGISAQVGDTALYWAFKRVDGTTPSVSLSTGTSVDASSVANVGGAYRTAAISSAGTLTVSSTVPSGGNVDALAVVIVSDATISGATDTALELATALSSTALLYKGRGSATNDAAGGA